VVPVALVGAEISPPVQALVDSGCEHVLADWWLAHAAGVDPKGSAREIKLGLGGDSIQVRFVDVRMRLFAPDSPQDEHFAEWEGEVGFVQHWRPTWPMLLGQIGFLDQFTVTMSRLAATTAVEHKEVFDQRFGVPLAPPTLEIRKRRTYP
jgi:hypothetical protein